MNKALQARLIAYDRERCALLAEVEALDAKTLSARPQPDQWSILEIVEHLVLSERWILQNLPAPSALVIRTQTLKNRLMYPVVMFVLKYHVTVPVPGKDGLPKGNVSLVALGLQWEESQRWLRRHVDEMTAAGTDRAVFAHPVTGPLTAAQAVHMGHLHLRYHARQIRERVRK